MRADVNTYQTPIAELIERLSGPRVDVQPDASDARAAEVNRRVVQRDGGGAIKFPTRREAAESYGRSIDPWGELR